MKNRRDICGAKDAGWIQYPGLTGCIKTGCMSSPSFKSPFCEEHKIRCAEDCTSDALVVEMLLAKKETRSGKYYQVCMYLLVLSPLHLTCIMLSLIYAGTLARKIRHPCYMGARVKLTTFGNKRV